MTTSVDGTLGIVTTGNVTANNFFGNITGNFAGNITTAGNITAGNIDAGNLLTANYVAATAGTMFLGNLQVKEFPANTFAVYLADGITQANIDVGNVDVSQITQGTSVIGFTGVNGNAYVRIAGSNVVGVTPSGISVANAGSNILVANNNGLTVSSSGAPILVANTDGLTVNVSGTTVFDATNTGVNVVGSINVQADAAIPALLISTADNSPLQSSIIAQSARNTVLNPDPVFQGDQLLRVQAQGYTTYSGYQNAGGFQVIANGGAVPNASSLLNSIVTMYSTDATGLIYTLNLDDNGNMTLPGRLSTHIYSNVSQPQAFISSRARGTDNGNVFPVQAGDGLNINSTFGYTGNGTTTVDNITGWSYAGGFEIDAVALPGGAGNYIPSQAQIKTVSTANVVNSFNFDQNGNIDIPGNTVYLGPNSIQLKAVAADSFGVYLGDGVTLANFLNTDPVPGNSGELIFNDAGTLGASIEMSFSPSSNTLTIGTVSHPANLQVIGDATFTGNANVVGNINVISGNSGQFFGDIVTGLEALYAGLPTGYTTFANSVYQMAASVNGYAQMIAQNVLGGAQSSFDYVITTDTGDDSQGYIDMGIASSTWDGSAPTSIGNAIRANDGYLYTDGGNTVVATSSAGKYVKINVEAANDTGLVATFSQAAIVANTNFNPSTDNTHSLGNSTHQWQSLWVAGNTIYLEQIPLTMVGAGPTSNLQVNGANVLTQDANGNISVGNINASGRISATGNVTGGNINTGGVVAATGNITGANITTAGKVVATGNVDGGNINTGGVVAATGNITGGNLVTLGNVDGNNINATANITATKIVATGNISGGNLNTVGGVWATANVTAGNLTTPGNVTAIGNVVGGNINALTDVVATGNVSGGNLITSGIVSATGNVSGSNITTTGNVTAAGNLVSGNIESLGSVSGVDYIAAGNIVATGNIAGGNLNTAGRVVATGNVEGANLLASAAVIATGNVSGGNLNTSGQAVVTGNITSSANINGANLTTNGVVVATGNITGGNLNTLGNAVVGGIKTDNYLYANGAPVDFEQPAGANTQVQYNNNGSFGASATFAFDSATNVLTVGGNIGAGNIAATGRVDGATLNVTGNANVGNIGTAAVVATGAITGASIAVTGIANVGGAANIVGDIITAGNANVTGNLNITGNISQVTTQTARIFGDPVTGFDALQVGIISGFTPLVDAVIQTSTNFDNYTQINQQNVNNGPAASADYVVTANDGDDTNYYLDMGLAGSGWDGSQTNSLGNAIAPHDGYLYVKDGNLVTGAASAGKVMKILVGAANDTGLVATFNPPGTVSTTPTTGALTITGGLGVSANINAVNVRATGNVVAVGNVNTTGFFNGDGGFLSNIQAGSSLVSGTSNVRLAPSGNASISVNGVSNVLVVTATGANLAGTLDATGDITAGNVYANAGTIKAAQFVGDAGNLANITAANITGVVANANYAAYAGNVTIAAQANITSLGTLTALATSGNITTVANIYANTGIIGAQHFIGEGGNISNITAGNITGQVANALVAGTVYTAAQPNITSVGTLTSLGVSGGVTASTLTSNVATGTAPFVVTSTTVVANLRVEAATTAGTVTTAAQPNITSLGTLTGLDVNGIVTAGTLVSNVATGTPPLTVTSTTVVANLNVENATTAGTVTTAAQPNITSLGTLTALDVTGNINAGNVIATTFVGNLVGNISAPGVNTDVLFNDSGLANATGDMTFNKVSKLFTVTGNIVGGNLVTAGVANVTGDILGGANANIIANVNAGNLVSDFIYSKTLDLTITTPVNKNILLVPSGAGNVDVNLRHITQLADPINIQDAATKAYVDQFVQGILVKASVKAGTTTALPAYSYNQPGGPGVGVGATITALAAGILTLDGVNITLGNRVLIKNETAGLVVVNGIYVMTTEGTAGVPFVLTRSTDMDLAAETPGAFTFVSQGATLADSGWVCTADTPVVYGTTSITWSQFSGAGSYLPGAGIDLVGTTFYANVDGTSTDIVAGNIAIKNGAILTNPNITNATGQSITLSGGNSTFTGAVATLSGNVTAGNVSGGNLVSATYLQGILTSASAAQPNITSLGTLTGLGLSGNLTSTANIYANSGIIGAAAFIGDAGNLSNITAANITGTIANANYAAYAGNITIAAQPNITSVGTLTSLAVSSGDIVTATGNIYANIGNIGAAHFIGEAGNLSNITAANIVGVVDDANYAAYAGNIIATYGAQPNITSVGTLTSLAVSGAASVGSLSSLGQVQALGNVSGANLTTGGVVVATGNVSGANLITAGQVTAAGNIISSANVEGVNFNASGDLAVVGDSAVTGNSTVGGNATITGNVSVGNITTGGNITATAGGFFVGDGGFLSNLTVAGGTAIVNGSSNISIPVGGGNINFAVAGVGAGKITTTSVSMGLGAGGAGTFSTAIGPGAGSTGQGTQGVALGYNAGATGQGAAAVAIGAFAGQTNQTAGSIAINASGAPLNTTGAGLFINPVRSDAVNITRPIFYDTATSELTYSTAMDLAGDITAGNVYANAGTIGALNLTATTVTGTLSTAAQTNITSVGTLVSLNVTGVTNTGSLTTTTLSAGSAGTAGTITGDWTLTPGSVLQATYADLGERYSSDEHYEAGTVMMIGGEREVTIANSDGRYRLAGIISTNPAYVLNSTCEDSVIIALAGRVPCKVVGTVRKGDLLTISSIDGVACVADSYVPGTIIGRALQDYTGEGVGVIEVKVDRG